MKKTTTIIAAIGTSFALGSLALADDIEFTTLPQPVQTTVFREAHITVPTNVTRVIREDNGIYAVTVHRDTGNQVVYVNDSGALVQQPQTTVVERQAPQTVVEKQAPQTVVAYDQVQQDNSRYQLLEKKGKKEVYFDRQTGQKVTVKRDNDD